MGHPVYGGGPLGLNAYAARRTPALGERDYHRAIIYPLLESPIFFEILGRNFDSGVRFSESATSISSKMNIGCHFFMEIRADFFLNGIWDSGGFRRVRSGVRIRMLLTRASGTLLASRLGKCKIDGFYLQGNCHKIIQLTHEFSV